MRRHPWLRLAAWLIDWCCIIVWAALVAAVAVPLYRTGALHGMSTAAANALAAAVLVLPVTIALAVLESATGATVGKRIVGLRVTAPGRPRLGSARALLRNALKIALPWLIGHAAVYAITDASASGSVPVGVWALTGAAYALPIVWVVTLFVGSGRTPYDRIAGTAVARTGEAPRAIRLFPDYSAPSPLWEDGGMVPADYGLPAGLSEALMRWQRYFDAHFHWESGWDAETDVAAYDAEGRRLTDELREQLPGFVISLRLWWH